MDNIWNEMVQPTRSLSIVFVSGIILFHKMLFFFDLIRKNQLMDMHHKNSY